MLCGMFGILPAAIAAFRASTQAFGSWETSGEERGKALDHANYFVCL